MSRCLCTMSTKAQAAVYEVVQSSRYVPSYEVEQRYRQLCAMLYSGPVLCTRLYKGPGACVRGRAKVQVLIRGRCLTKVQAPQYEVARRPRPLCTRAYKGAGAVVRGCAKV
eukprot:4212711-Alexandrium_andersonii.AAC.1